MQTYKELIFLLCFYEIDSPLKLRPTCARRIREHENFKGSDLCGPSGLLFITAIYIPFLMTRKKCRNCIPHLIIVNVSYITPYDHTDVGCNYHWYYLCCNIMAEAFDESFNTFEELEISEMEEPASFPNFDNVTTFSKLHTGKRKKSCVDLNSVCFKVLVPIKIFQFSDMHYENRFLDTFRNHNMRPTPPRFQKKIRTQRKNYGKKTACQTIVPSWTQHTHGMVCILCLQAARSWTDTISYYS